jgi:hypothetical protein
MAEKRLATSREPPFFYRHDPCAIPHIRIFLKRIDSHVLTARLFSALLEKPRESQSGSAKSKTYFHRLLRLKLLE